MSERRRFSYGGLQTIVTGFAAVSHTGSVLLKTSCSTKMIRSATPARSALRFALARTSGSISDAIKVRGLVMRFARRSFFVCSNDAGENSEKS